MILGDVGYVAVGLPLNNGSVAAPKKLYLLPELAIADWIHHLAHTVDSWHYGVAHSRSRMGQVVCRPWVRSERLYDLIA